MAGIEGLCSKRIPTYQHLETTIMPTHVVLRSELFRVDAHTIRGQSTGVAFYCVMKLVDHAHSSHPYMIYGFQMLPLVDVLQSLLGLSNSS